MLMNSPLALFLAGAGGICLLVGGWYVGGRYSTAGTREPEGSRSVALRLFGAACLVIAGQEYAALGVYRALDLESYLGAVRWHAVFSLAAPVAIIWFIALYTRMAARWLLWIYSGIAATVIVLNLASPTTMHFSDLIEVGGVALPWGERLTQATAIPSRGPVESTAGGRARLSYHHHRSRTPRSTASVGVTRGRVRVFRFRDRAGIRAAAKPRGRPLPKMSHRFF